MSSGSFVVGCVNEIPFDFTSDLTGEGMKVEVREDLEGIVAGVAADNAFSWNA
jgi:hypothetical protein